MEALTELTDVTISYASTLLTITTLVIIGAIPIFAIIFSCRKVIEALDLRAEMRRDNELDEWYWEEEYRSKMKQGGYDLPGPHAELSLDMETQDMLDEDFAAFMRQEANAEASEPDIEVDEADIPY